MQPIEYTLRLCASVAGDACRICQYRDDPQCVTHLKNAAAAEIESLRGELNAQDHRKTAT